MTQENKSDKCWELERGREGGGGAEREKQTETERERERVYKCLCVCVCVCACAPVYVCLLVCVWCMCTCTYMCWGEGEAECMHMIYICTNGRDKETLGGGSVGVCVWGGLNTNLHYSHRLLVQHQCSWRMFLLMRGCFCPNYFVQPYWRWHLKQNKKILHITYYFDMVMITINKHENSNIFIHKIVSRQITDF